MAAVSVSADGHFNIPEGTITIVARNWEGKGECSWRKWGVDKYAVKTVTITDSVTAIGNWAFYGCRSLASIVIPDSVTAIEERAFDQCRSLASVTIPDSITAIAAVAFNSCESLTSITIPDSVTTIGSISFNSCSSLAYITIPDTLATIGASVFNKCNVLSMMLVKPVAASNGGVVAENLWNKMFELPVEGDEMFWEGRGPGGEFFEEQAMPFEHVTRIWAPDAIVNELTGPFAAYSTFASIPRAMRAAPDAKTWASVQLWLWWSPPTGAGYTNRDGVCNDARIVCKSRHAMLFTATMAGFKAVKSGSLPLLPPPIWLLAFGFVKHDETPAYAVV